MALPFLFSRMQVNLPETSVIIGLVEIADMIRISERGGVCSKERLPVGYAMFRRDLWLDFTPILNLKISTTAGGGSKWSP